MDSNTLLDAVKAKYGIASDYALARKILKVEITSLRDMRERGLGEARALQVAALLEIPPEEVLPAIRAERATDPAVKAVWQKVAESVRSALGVLAAVAICNLAIFAQPAEAAGKNTVSAFCTRYTLCDRLRRWLRRRFAATLEKSATTTGAPTTMSSRAILAFCATIALTACGGAREQAPAPTPEPLPPPPWTGGLVGVWEPESEARAAIILHHGHSNFFGEPPFPKEWDLGPVAQAFAAAGFVAYGMEMPPPTPGKSSHDDGPMEKFTDPVIALLDAIEPTGLPVYMAGVSGGAWTTVVITAMDTRITRGYAVEGGFPCLSDCDPGDWEQRHTDYDHAYAAAGERLTAVAIPGSASDCATLALPIPCVNDMTTDKHVISPWAVDWIIADIGVR